MSQPAPLPALKRILNVIDPSSTDQVKHDIRVDTLQFNPMPTGSQLAFVFAQPGMKGQPETAVAQLDKPEDNMVFTTNGSASVILDIPPRHEGKLHYTNTLDYLVIIQGRMRFDSADGQTFHLGPGDSMVQIAAPHAFLNETDEWVRLFGVFLPSEASKVGGKTLDQAPFNMDKMY